MDPRFLSLRDGLATNRYKAWEQIQPLRKEAAGAVCGGSAERVFVRQVGLTLDDLLVLFEHPGWRESARGGNAWLLITQMAAKLRVLIDDQEEIEASRLVVSILQSRHNTGRIGDKLKDLDGYLDSHNRG